MNQLEMRVAKLEKNLMLYRMFFVLISLGGLSAVLMSSGKKDAVPDVIQAKSFQVIDDYGTTITATLGKDKGNGSLTTYSSGGKKLVSLINFRWWCRWYQYFSDNDGDLLFKVTRTTGER